MKGILYYDDAQIAIEHLAKTYGTNPGCEVRLRKLTFERKGDDQ